MGKGLNVFFRAILAIFIFSTMIPFVLSECECATSTPYCSGTCTYTPGGCDSNGNNCYDPTYSCDSCTACPYNNCVDASNPEPDKNICNENTCIECTTATQCIEKHDGDQNYYCTPSNTCAKTCEYNPDYPEQPLSCNAVCSGGSDTVCNGCNDASCEDVDDFQYQFVDPEAWLNRFDKTKSYAAASFDGSAMTLLKIDASGIKYYTGSDYTAVISKSLKEYNSKLCEQEGTYRLIYYTDKLTTTIAGETSQDALKTGPITSIYTVNAQLSENLCTCVQNKINTSTGLGLLCNDAVGPYQWNDSAKLPPLQGGGGLDFACCGPWYQSDKDVNQDKKTECVLSSNEKYLCNQKRASHASPASNEWLVAQLTSTEGGSGNLDCAYNTACGYWVLSNETTREDGTADAKWIKCSDTINANNPNIEMRSKDGYFSYNSFGCFKTTSKLSGIEDTFKIYECRNTVTQSGGSAPLCGLSTSTKAGDDVITKHTDKTPNKKDFIYVNSTAGMYFCLQNGSFEKDLDSPEGVLPVEAKYQTCELDGFLWTGSKCCNETDQFLEFPTGEFYNDLSQEPIGLTYTGNTKSNGRKAGCWNGTRVLSGQRLNDTKAFPPINPTLRQIYNTSSVINYNGTFYGCNLSAQIVYNGVTIDNPLLAIRSSYEKTASNESDYLIKQGMVQGTVAGNIGDASGSTNLVICSSLPDAAADQSSPYKNYSYYCAMDNTWKLMEQGQKKMSPKETRPDLMTTTSELGNPKLKDLPKYDCCARTRCWNGTICINSTEEAYRVDQSVSSTIQASTSDSDKSYICVEAGQDSVANWTEFTGYKSTWDMHYEGVCPKKTQCLVEKAGDPSLNDPADYFSATSPSSMPKCIDDQEYIEDHYCDNGNWTTRTKRVAEHLAENTGLGDYSLFCDTPKNALNKIDYTMGNNYVKNYFTDADSTIINNICVLKTSDKIVFGASLNKNINETGFPDIIGVSASSKPTYCASGSQDGAFTICSNSGSWKVYYDKTDMIVIFTKDSFTTTEPTQTFEKKYGTANMITHLRDLTTYPSKYSNNDATFYNLTHDYNKIYAMKQGTKSAIAFSETNFIPSKGWTAEYMAAKYVGFQDVDVCNHIIYYIKPPQSGDVPSTTVCDGGDDNTYTYYAFGSSDSDDGRGLLSAWTDLTAKMRPK